MGNFPFLHADRGVVRQAAERAGDGTAAVAWCLFAAPFLVTPWPSSPRFRSRRTRVRVLGLGWGLLASGVGDSLTAYTQASPLGAALSGAPLKYFPALPIR
jgi:hypothetical protein